MSTVEVNALSKSFWDSKLKVNTEVLKNIHFSVEDGEFIAILGPSGCGKSTLLRLVAGLEEATIGSIRIDSQDMTDTSPHQRKLAMVFQNYALFPHLTVARNIAFGLKARKIDPQVRDKRVKEIAELLELDALLDRRPVALSGGQRQRVALGRALVSGHNLILMDEPLSNLDARLRAEMRSEIRRIQEELKLTVLYVTHDQVEAMTMADRVLVMRGGIIEQIAAPAQLYSHPETVNVARFIGSPPMNIIHSDTGALTAALPEGSASAILGVRPEDLFFTPPQDEAVVKVCSATIRQEELLGADRLVYATTTGTPAEKLTVRVAPSLPVNVGDSVTFYAKESSLRWFDAHSQRALR